LLLHLVYRLSIRYPCGKDKSTKQRNFALGFGKKERGMLVKNEVIYRFIQSLHRRDVTAMSQCLSDEVHMLDFDGCMLTGKTEVMKMWQRAFALFACLHIRQLSWWKQYESGMMSGYIDARLSADPFVPLYLPIAIMVISDENVIKYWQSYCDIGSIKALLKGQMHSTDFCASLSHMRKYHDHSSLLRHLQTWFSAYLLVAVSEQNRDDIRKIYEGNPTYFYHLHTNAQQELAQLDIHELPQGKTLDDKAFFMLYHKGEPLCALDLIVEYPDTVTAFIGFFMMNKAYQKKGMGTAIIHQLCSCLKSNGFLYARLGYVKSNEESKHFWERHGFYPTGIEVVQQQCVIVVTQKYL